MQLPKNATLSPKPFKISIPQAELDDFKTLLRLSKLAPATYEGTQEKFGLTNKWMSETKAYWESTFDWRKHEEGINKFPQYTTAVKNRDGNEYTIHFIGITSDRPDAIPLLLLHGWPGSFIEFLIIKPLSASTSPAFHIIVPSLPGYAFSSQAPLDKEFTTSDAAYLINELMVGLGFGKDYNGGYVAQGGDIGSAISRILQYQFDDCKAVHLNAILSRDQHPLDGLDEVDLRGLEHGKKFATLGLAYAVEHATRPSTIGHVIASSPLALLAWVGEKLLEWSDESPPIEKILQLITLWWFTETFPRSIYPYRELWFSSSNPASIKPIGYSLFPKENIPIPKKWAEIEIGGAMIWFKRKDRGGHFAAMEVPEVLAVDIKDFVEFLQKREKTT